MTLFLILAPFILAFALVDVAGILRGTVSPTSGLLGTTVKGVFVLCMFVLLLAAVGVAVVLAILGGLGVLAFFAGCWVLDTVINTWRRAKRWLRRPL